MKNTYIAISIQENEKNYAYAIKVNESENLLSKLKIKGITHANICSTKKQAEKVVNYWNECYKNNGTNLF